MATLKKKKKTKTIIIIVVIVVIIAAIVAACIIYSNVNSKEQVSLYTISTDDIYETVDATGEISSGAEMDYSVSSIATVKDVYVKTGDEVKEGDLLATFDTSSLDEEINSLEKTYNKAQNSYYQSLQDQSDAKGNLQQVENQINSLEKQIASLEKNLTSTTKSKKATTKKTTTTKKATTNTTRNAFQDFTVDPSTASTVLTTINIDNLTSTTAATDSTATTTTTTAPSSSTTDTTGTTIPISDILSSLLSTTASSESTTAITLQELVDSINTLITTINTISADVQTANQLINIAMQTLSDSLDSIDLSQLNQVTVDSIADSVSSAVEEAIKENMISEDDLIVAVDDAVDIIAQAVESIDWESYAKSAVAAASESDTAQLASLETDLAKLYIQKELYTLASSDTTVEAQKEILDTSKKALDSIKDTSADLSAGWTAAFDGTITDCSITPGEQVSLLSDCITLENLNSLVVTVSLNEYDIHKVSVGDSATVTTAYGTYSGTVTSKALTATGGSTGSILDSIGDIAGISGLSSLTESGAGVEVQITVDHPDENIIVGFDANVVINTGEYLGVTVVPIESILLEKTGSYVYLYNEDDNTVTKTPISTGAVSDSVYEVTDGLSVGDKVVATPSSTYDEDTFEVKVTN